MFRYAHALAWLDRFSNGRASDRRPRFPASLTRRDLLIGSVAASAGLLLSDGSSGLIQVLQSAEGIVVRLDGLEWAVLRGSFGERAKIRYRGRADEHRIQVDRSASAHLGISTDFSATLRLVNGQWWLFLRFPHLGAMFKVPFRRWLAGTHRAEAWLTEVGSVRARVGAASSSLELLGSKAALTLAPDWSFHWHSEQPIVSASVQGLTVSSREAQLVLGRRRSADVFDLVHAGDAHGCARLELVGPALQHPRAAPGTIGSQHLTLNFNAVTRAEVAVAVRPDGAAAPVFSVAGEAEAGVTGRGVDGEPTEILSGLRFAPVALVQRHDSQECLLAARVARAAHSVDINSLVISLAGAEGDGVVTTFRGGEASPITIAAELYGADIPVLGADTGALTFTPTPLQIVVGSDKPEGRHPKDNPWLPALDEQHPSAQRVQAQPPPVGSASSGPKPPAVPENAEEPSSGGGGLLVLDKTPFFVAPLDKARLQVLRSQDLFSLAFGFRNFAIKVKDGRAFLVPQGLTPHVKGASADRLEHKLIVEFPPQHIAEHAKKTQLGLGPKPVDIDERHRLRQPGSDKPPPEDNKEAFETVVRARLSQPTRLVFRINEQDANHQGEKELSVRTLTEWSELAQIVSERALPLTIPLAEQLKLVGIGKGTSRAEALAKIIQSIRPPRDDETAIEFPYRLILSPDSRARWITPQRTLGPPEKPTPLWAARLDPVDGGRSVRAIWARDILLDFLRGNPAADRDRTRVEFHEPATGPGNPPRPLTFSLSRSDRRELVALSSVYGLPALRGIILDKDAALKPNPNPKGEEDPAGTVQPFPGGIGQWDRRNPQKPTVVKDEGVYVPKPLAAADLLLTAMGGTFVGEGQWEPPSPIVFEKGDPDLDCGTGLPNDPPLPCDPDLRDNWAPSLRLERWRHRAVLGRDIFVEVAYKGFLFPIGHRASLLKVTERRFYPHPVNNRPTAYLIQRLFIVIGKRDKHFPAVGQAYDGRLWPAHTITMVTGRTPDLVDPEDSDVGAAEKNGWIPLKREDGTDAPGLVFWPRVGQGPDNDVVFEFRKDDDPEPIRARLIFVDNVAAHYPDTMRALVRTYRNLAPFWRTAEHGSVRRRYAASTKDGETDFDTQSWELSVTGRYNEKAGGKPEDRESFRMDGIMEGADQPPYYPVMRTANITVQSIDRLLGKPTGGMTVAFDELFVRHAFAPDQNPSELFLDVLSPAIQLDLSGSGDAVGGFAKPSTRVVALSRKFGPVGGRGPQSQGGNGRRNLATLSSDPHNGPIGGLDDLPPTGDFKAFAQGRFDPMEFLGGADRLPKLLGIFSLADVLKAVSFGGSTNTNEQNAKEQKVPKLQEKTLFGGGGAIGEQLAAARQVIGKAADRLIGDGSPGSGLIGQALAEIEAAVRERFDANFSWRSLYPRFGAAFDLLVAQIKVARAKLESATLDELFDQGSRVVAASKALIAEAQAIRDNPMPPLLADILVTVRGQWEKVRQIAELEIDGSKAQLDRIIGDLQSNVLGGLTQLCRDAFEEEPRLIELLFGDPEAKACPDFATIDPDEVYKRLSDALLYEVAGEPIARAHEALRVLAREISAIVEDQARDVGPKVIALTTKVFDAALALARMAETSGALAAGEVKTACKIAIDLATFFSSGTITSGTRLAGQIGRIAINLDALQVPAQTPPPIRARIDEARAAAAQAHERVARAVAELEQRRSQLGQVSKQCDDTGGITEALGLSGKILALRRDAVAALQDVILQAHSVAAALDEALKEHGPSLRAAARATFQDDIAAARAAVSDIVGATLSLLEDATSISKVSEKPDTWVLETLKPLADKLQGQLQRHFDELKTASEQLTASANGLAKRISALRDPGAALDKWLIQGEPFPPDLAALGSEVLAFATQHDRRIAALALQAAPTFDRMKNRLGQTAAGALTEVVKPLIAVHDVALSVLDAMGQIFDPASGTDEERRRAEFLISILQAEIVDALKDTSQIKAERDELEAIRRDAGAQATWPGAFQKADSLKKRWAAQEPALARALRGLARVVESLGHGDLSALIDLDGVREFLEAELKNVLAAFLPTRFEQSYDWKTAIQPVGDLFKMSAEPSDDDLVLSAKVTVDLLRPQDRSAVVVGRMKPFTVYILGRENGGRENSRGTFLTLRFGDQDDDKPGAEFSSVNGSRPDFKANLQKVEIGPGLEFVQKLQSFLSYSDDSGFYVRPTVFPLGIEAGFEYSEEVVALGGLILYNVGFFVSAQLPFEDRDARFRFALASADAPLIISYPPYGGGGFVALTANGREFVEVECSFEFGAIVGISFGPLSAVGRVMAGIYIRFAQGGGAYIKGFVHAVGEGNIACFSICVNIEVAIFHENGNMHGSSTYRITFKVGVAEMPYEFIAGYKVQGGGGSSAPMAPFAGAGKPAPGKLGCGPNEVFYKVIERVPPKTRRWKDYTNHFDLDLLKA